MAAKKPPDPRGGHTRVYWAIQDSMAWRALSFSAIALYMAMRRKLQGTNNGNIEATITTLRHAGFKSPSTLAKGLKELQAVGLIDKTRQGGIAWGNRMCSLYRFTDEQVFEHPKLGITKLPATNEWQKLDTLAAAERAIAASLQNKSGLQNLYRSSTDSVAVREISDTDSVVDAPLLLQKSKQSARAKSSANPHAH